MDPNIESPDSTPSSTPLPPKYTKALVPHAPPATTAALTTTTSTATNSMTASRPHHQQRVVSNKTAPSNGNTFTRFMKTSNGAEVSAPLPRSEQELTPLATLTTKTGIATLGVTLNPLPVARPEPRRQLGVLCNHMTTLDMVELAHHVIPSVSLGSPRLEVQPPARIGAAYYDYGKHVRATGKVIERADAALGQRANMSVVFYRPNPGALTSRRDFKLITVPNHRDIIEALEQQQHAKKAPRCAFHATAGFEPSSSEDEGREESRGEGGVGIRRKKLRKGVGVSGGGKLELMAGGAITPSNASPISVATNGASTARARLGVDGVGGSSSTSKLTPTPLTTAGGSPILLDGHVSKGPCSCVHCTYVQRELDAFERARDPATAGKNNNPRSGAGKLNTSGANKKLSLAASSPRNNNRNNNHNGLDGSSNQHQNTPRQRNEQHRRFLGGPAFVTSNGGANGVAGAGAVSGGLSGGGQQPASQPLLQRLMSLQAAFQWLRGLDRFVHGRLRLAILIRFPTLRQDADVVTSLKQRRFTVADLFSLVAADGIAPTRRDADVVFDEDTGNIVERAVENRFALPSIPRYPIHHFKQAMAASNNNNHHQQSNSNTGSSTTSPTTMPLLLTPAHVESMRSWEELFALLDPELSGMVDKYQLLLTLVAATSHHIILEPEALKFDSRAFSYAGTMVQLLTTTLTQERRATDGPIRLGEIFAIRDFLRSEIRAARAMSLVDATGWIDTTPVVPVPPKKLRQHMLHLDDAESRVANFSRSAADMIEREELLDVAQVKSLLEDVMLL